LIYTAHDFIVGLWVAREKYAKSSGEVVALDYARKEGDAL
jgi:hypothetical protein